MHNYELFIASTLLTLPAFLIFICHELPDPSICVQWLPEINDERTYRLLIGTILENEENAIYILKIKLRDYPEYVINEDELQLQTENEEMYAEMHSQVTILHKSQVNRIRYCPHKQFIIASQASDGNIYLFDYRNHPSKRGPFDKFEPLVTMEGQKQEGIGLAWNPHEAGILLSSSRDCCIYEWNVISNTDHQTLNPTRIFSSHSAGVEDIDWHAFTSAVFCSVGCDGNLFIWDNRNSENSRPALSVCAHKQDVNCVSFNPFSEYLLATGSSDKTVAIWDLRNLNESLNTLLDHTGEVNEVRWAPQSEFIIASCSEDCTVNVYDMSHSASLIENNCSSELIFSHRGHRNPVQSLSWNANEPWLVASISNDAVLHLWKIFQSSVYAAEDSQLTNNKNVYTFARSTQIRIPCYSAKLETGFDLYQLKVLIGKRLFFFFFFFPYPFGLSVTSGFQD
ncbi:putative histone-binding protein Caf1 [Trichinella pseudospiralis]|uniref:Putative histone-binding protein Caf1 n=1 Tax=Trichinella pseudospiralis TaxID=6337 RepID=A0A0V1EW95_TRIPS|nr:putative histone-binding protein Caf1 [Trichinella pseudospiralis]